MFNLKNFSEILKNKQDILKKGSVSEELFEKIKKALEEKREKQLLLQQLNSLKKQHSSVSSEAQQIKEQRKELKLKNTALENILNELFYLVPCPASSESSSFETTEGRIIKTEIFKKRAGTFKYLGLSKQKYIVNAGIKRSTFYFFVPPFSKLQDLLISLLKKHLRRKKLIEITNCPLFLEKESFFSSGHLPKFEKNLYSVNTSFALIPTGECALLHLLKVFPLNLNSKNYFFTETDCFRNEAGNRKDLKHLARVNQFKKVEVVCICSQDLFSEQAVLFEILSFIEEILSFFEIDYRFREIHASDLPFSSARTIDVEIFAPNSKKWLEVSSVSSTRTFQSQRLFESKKLKEFFCYNGSVLALPRLLCVLTEIYSNNKQEILFKELEKKILSF